MKNWPNTRPRWEIGSNTRILSIGGKEIGLSYNIDDKEYSVHLNHPLAEFWLSIFRPIWTRNNAGKCKTCGGSGWDGIGYTLSCLDCKK